MVDLLRDKESEIRVVVIQQLHDLGKLHKAPLNHTHDIIDQGRVWIFVSDAGCALKEAAPHNDYKADTLYLLASLQAQLLSDEEEVS